MNKTLLKNPWVLAGLLLLITTIVGLVVHSINKQWDIKLSSAMASVIAALITGQIYTFKCKEIIGKKLSLTVSSIAVAIQFAAGIWLGLASDFAKQEWTMYLVGLIPITIITFLGTYFLLRTGGKSFLKIMEKQEELKRKKGLKGD